MNGILVIGVDRPGLPAALAALGLASAPVALVRAGAALPPTPAVVEAAAVEEAAALLGAGAADVVLQSDPDLLVAARLAALARRLASARIVLAI